MSNNNKDKVVSDNEVVNVIEFDSIKFKSEVEKIKDTNEIRFMVNPLQSKLNEINFQIEDTQKVEEGFSPKNFKIMVLPPGIIFHIFLLAQKYFLQNVVTKYLFLFGKSEKCFNSNCSLF